VTAPGRTAAAAAIDAAEAELGVVQALLLSDDGPAVDAARHLLASIEAQLGRLASAADTDTETAARLVSVRADLSGHLLAAGALENAGAPPDGVARMLRRAVGTARDGLAPRTPVGAGRR
jgi:hypothetical protein